MQAPLSFIASGEHVLSGLPSSSTAFAAVIPDSAYPKREQFALEPSLALGSIADGIGLAHDAGNLLGAIRLYCDLLALPGVLRKEHRHYADELLQLTARSGSLIDRLLRPSVPSAGSETTKPKIERIRLAEAVTACRGMLDKIAAPGSLLIAVESGAQGGVGVPREALERILVNLTKNAAEAGTAGAIERGEEAGTIAVRVRSVTAWGPDGVAALALSVEDCGRGMEEAQLRAVLTGQAAPFREQRPGRGIGLRVVRELIAQTGGELRMRSCLGRGTTVEIVWPVSPSGGAESG